MASTAQITVGIGNTESVIDCCSPPAVYLKQACLVGTCLVVWTLAAKFDVTFACSWLHLLKGMPLVAEVLSTCYVRMQWAPSNDVLSASFRLWKRSMLQVVKAQGCSRMWEPQSNLAHAGDTLTEYWHTQAAKPGPPR